ncbi:hypothetical protein KAR91_21815 [Candidatus Pacearchaeota archaeon]|nr:hypothetical protein [Candidatus Pacearchaeota archaeon]
MKCFFRDRDCVVPDEKRDSGMCRACASFESNNVTIGMQEAMVKAAESQTRVADAMTPKEIEGRPDDKRDVQ